MFKVIGSARMPQLDLNGVVKFHERRYSPFSISAWVRTLRSHNTNPWFFNCFPIWITVYHNGVATTYRRRVDEERFQKGAGEHLMESAEVREKILSAYDQVARRLRGIFRKIDAAEEIGSRTIQEFNDCFGDFCVFVMLVQRSIDFIVKHKNQRRLTKALIKTRTKHENLMYEYEVYLTRLCQKLAKQSRWKHPSLLRLLTRDELIKFTEQGVVARDLEKRRQCCALIITPRPYLLVGRSCSILLNALNKQTSAELHAVRGKFIQGVGVHPGVILGRAQILPKPTQLTNFKPGGILVTVSTLPQYVDVIKRAKGIIADEGGLLSHAAILSREFKIPAIVGTKIATKVFKDGDLVEVDAEKGIVKKI